MPHADAAPASPEPSDQRAAESLDEAVPMLTRRERQRRQTREEILDAALAVITENGAAALNLTEVARRVGLRQPSLYQYFDSRLAVYDALFARGMAQHLDLVRHALATREPGLAALREIVISTVRFSVDNPVLAQLVFAPTVPGFEPSEQAYRPSLTVQELMAQAMQTAVDRRELHRAAASEHGVSLLIALSAGIASLQLANDQHSRFDQGRYTPLVEPALAMYTRYFAPDQPADWTP